jgi:hypothetical protein
MIYTTDSDTYATTSLTSAGRAILDDADAAAQRTTLGLAIGTDVQAYDAGLQSISGLTTSADQMIYTTGSDTYATTSLTAAGRAILDDADVTAQRATLGLVIGTDVQAYDAGLQSISGLTTSADQMIYTTGSDTYATTSLTAAGRAILDDADATTQRATLGLVIGTDVQAYDAELAAIEAGALTADQMIVRAIEAGKDSTAAGLRAVVAALTGQAVPAFATGGYHTGGLRLVGENGPELESTGPARIWNANQTAAMMRGAGGNDNAAVVAAIKSLEQKMQVLQEQIVVNTGKHARKLERWDIDGVPVRSALAESEAA